MSGASLVAGLIQWDATLEALIARVGTLRVQEQRAAPGGTREALALERERVARCCAVRFGLLNGWHWRAHRLFSLSMLAANRARARAGDQAHHVDGELDHPDYYWSDTGPGGRPAALLSHNYGHVRCPDVVPALRRAQHLYRLPRLALAVLTLPRSWYSPGATTAFLIVPATRLRCAA
jgi:hypothetical protein